MVICHTCHKEHAGPLKTCPSCRAKIDAWKKTHNERVKLHKRKYVAIKRGYEEDTDFDFFKSKTYRPIEWASTNGMNPDDLMSDGRTRRENSLDEYNGNYPKFGFFYGDNRIKEATDLNVWQLGMFDLVKVTELWGKDDSPEIKEECITLLRKAHIHIGNVLRENGVIMEGF